MENQHNNIALDNKNITIIGAGVIGASWAAVFLAKGMNVTISDPKENIAQDVKDYVQGALTELSQMGLNTQNISLEKNQTSLFFEKDLAVAVSQADYIQENGPENRDFKANLWKEVEAHAPNHTFFLSSSSGITATQQATQLTKPERLIIGHPFNPPHLMPLVEVVPGIQSDQSYIEHVLNFYSALGKSPKLLKKEVAGFVANRLQSAIFRECVALVQQGVVTVDELDDIVTTSLGIRWASGGPFLAFHLGGGAGGITHFLEHLTPTMELVWKDQQNTTVTFDAKTKQLIIDQINEKYGTESIPSLEKSMSAKEISIIAALK